MNIRQGKKWGKGSTILSGSPGFEQGGAQLSVDGLRLNRRPNTSKAGERNGLE